MTYVCVSEGQVGVEVKKVDEVVAGVSVVDELVVDDDEVIGHTLALLPILVGKEDVVGPKVSVAQGVDLGGGRRHKVSVECSVGLDVEEGLAPGNQAGLLALWAELVQDLEDGLLGHVLQLLVHDLGHLGLRPEPPQKRVKGHHRVGGVVVLPRQPARLVEHAVLEPHAVEPGQLSHDQLHVADRHW